MSDEELRMRFEEVKHHTEGLTLAVMFVIFLHFTLLLLALALINHKL